MIIKKSAVDSAIRVRKNRFYGLWSSERPPARMGVRNSCRFQPDSSQFSEEAFELPITKMTFYCK